MKIFCVFVVIVSFLSASNVLADISPVPIGFDYQSRAEVIDVHAQIGALVITGSEDGSGMQVRNQEHALVKASAWSEGEATLARSSAGNPLSLFLRGEAIMSASVGATRNASHTWGMFSNFHMEALGDGSAIGSGETNLNGIIQIGTSETIVAGTSGLELHVNALEAGWESWDALTWSLHISSLDPGNPLDITMDHSDPTAVVEILAGQSLNVEFTQNVAGRINAFNTLPDGGVEISFAVTPEPATLSLLVIGAMAMLRRRQR